MPVGAHYHQVRTYIAGASLKYGCNRKALAGQTLYDDIDPVARQIGRHVRSRLLTVGAFLRVDHDHMNFCRSLQKVQGSTYGIARFDT